MLGPPLTFALSQDQTLQLTGEPTYRLNHSLLTALTSKTRAAFAIQFSETNAPVELGNYNEFANYLLLVALDFCFVVE